MAFMKLTLDGAGRVVIPKPVRDELHLQAGDALEMETSGEDIRLRPVRGQAQLRKKSGVWVYRSGEALSADTVDKTLTEIRREREAQLLGKDE